MPANRRQTVPAHIRQTVPVHSRQTMPVHSRQAVPFHSRQIEPVRSSPQQADWACPQQAETAFIFLTLLPINNSRNPTTSRTHRQTVPVCVHSNVRAMSSRHAAGDIVGPTLLLMRGRKGRRISAVEVVQRYGTMVRCRDVLYG